MDTKKIISRIVFPNHLNDHQTLFGGIAMQWMDEAAYITAIRCCRKSMVTVKVNDLQFYHPLTTGMIAEIHSSVLSHGMVKLEILVEIYAEDVYLGTSHKAAHAIFTMAAVNKEMKVARLDDK